MTRTQKLYEALAILRQAQRKIGVEVNALKFAKPIRKQVSVQCLKVDTEILHLISLFESILETETGLNEKQKWVNAEKNTGGTE